MLCIGTIFLFVKFDFFIIRKFGNFVKQNSYRIKKKYLVCATLFFPSNPKFKIKKPQNVPKFKYFESEKQNCTTPPPQPHPQPHPHPKCFCKNCFPTTYQWKTVGISIHIFVILFLNTIYAVNSSPNNVTHLLA